MKWILVILTVTGGHDRPYPSLVACQRALHHTRVSPVREAFCMSKERDVVFYMSKDGKHVARLE